MPLFRLVIITPQGTFLDDEATFLEVKSEKYNLGITYNHSPLVSSLCEGLIKVTKKDEEKLFYISNGILKISENKSVTILVNSVRKG